MALSKADQTIRALRHSAVALLGAALQEVFPSIQLIGGRATSLGFVYDIVGNIPADVTTLTLVEERMRAIAGRGQPLKSLEMVRENAAEYFRHQRQNLKADALADYPEGLVSLLQIGDFLDLAPLPHVASLPEVKALCLLSSSTAPRVFPSGEELAVTSIAGTVHRDHRDLKAFVKTMKSLREMEHRVLGQEQDLFTIVDPDLCLWHPKGATLRDTLVHWWRKQLMRLGYRGVTTTGLYSKDEDAIPVSRSGRHALLYRCGLHSYRELPLGYFESSEVLECHDGLEKSGLFSQSIYTCPEAHLFCRQEDAQIQLQSQLRFLIETLKRFQLEFRAYITFGRANPGEMRKRAGEWLKQALKANGVAYEIDTEEEALEGPCVHLRVIDVMAREWIGPSLGVNIVQPEVLGLRYHSEQDTMVQPAMLEMRVFGSLERWIALILEQTKGELPLWLTPEQVRLLPVTAAHHAYAEEVQTQCEAAGLRVAIDRRDERLGAKIYAFEKAKVPFALILGKEEKADKKVTMRQWGEAS